MKKLIKNAITLIQAEINKYNTLYTIIVGNEPSQVIEVEHQFNILIEQNVEPIDKDG